MPKIEKISSYGVCNYGIVKVIKRNKVHMSFELPYTRID